MMLSNHPILCHSLLLPSIFPSIRVFSSKLALRMRWQKYWCFGLSINPSNEYSGLISFMIDCFDLLAVQGTLKSLLQHHCLKASVLQHSAFFMVQLSHPYMTCYNPWRFTDSRPGYHHIKNRDIALATKVGIVKAVVYPVVMYRCESWTKMKAECWRIDAFELWCWRRFLRVPWTARKSS